MLPEGWLEEFAEEGCFVTPPLFSEGELSALRAACEAERAGARGWAVRGAAGRSDVVLGFARHGG